MIKKIIIFSLVISALILMLNTYNENKTLSSISNYELLSPDDYMLETQSRSMTPLLEMSDGSDIEVQNFTENYYIALGTSGDESVILDKEWISEKLAGVMYIPSNEVIYAFGKDKPVNIMFGAPATESGDPYESPLYIGYYDGTCEYPAEFDYVRSKKKCSQYLQDTLDFVGYNTVDEMLEDVFGEYLTKDEN